MAKEILFSGIQPTGDIHLGNYLGALKNWVRLQHEYQSFFAIVDLHALTIEIKSEELRANTKNLAIDLLSIGIDPKKSVLFRQSDVPEHAELAWIFSCLTPIGELKRMTQFKDKALPPSMNVSKTIEDAQMNLLNAGLFTYPILMAADILLYRASRVPVGEDQLQHLELARVIARKFNNRYYAYFPEVKPVLSQDIRVMALNNPEKKMSKSLGPKSYIALRDTPEVIKQKIAKAITDSLDESTTLSGGHNLLMLFKNFSTPDEFQAFEREFKLKNISYAKLKEALTEKVTAFVKPIQEKQAYYEQHPREVEKVLTSGAKRARKIAQKNLKEIRKIIGLD